MTKSFVTLAGLLLFAPAAWAGPAPAQEGSGNNVNAALNPPATAAAPAPATSEAPRKVDSAPPGSGNNINAALATPAPAPAKPAPASVQSAQASMQPAQASSFNAAAYAKASDCMTAAAAANQPLSLCQGLKK